MARPTPVPEQLPVGFHVAGLGTIVEHPLHANGTFARVYRIRHDFDGSSVAGKLFHRHADSRSDAADRGLRNEVALLHGLAHRNVVRTYLPVPLGADGRWILVSEWIDGTTLEEYAYGQMRMTGDQVFAAGAQLLDGIAYLEGAGVVHRDIKPANVMLDRSGTIKLIDFNLTRPVGRETTISGSVQYLPPDVLAHGPIVDPMVDRYALGALLFELVTGDHPYLAEFLAGRHPTMRSIPADPSELRPGVDQGLGDFLTRAVMPADPARFASAEQMRCEWWQLEPSIRGLNMAAVSPELDQLRCQRRQLDADSGQGGLDRSGVGVAQPLGDLGQRQTVRLERGHPQLPVGEHARKCDSSWRRVTSAIPSKLVGAASRTNAASASGRSSVVAGRRRR